MKWTTNQSKAINYDNKNIIVSAGAGSGKTAVLTERVIRKLKEGIKISRLLILTFTNAAAAEMKKRIRMKIYDYPNLSNQLPYLDSAYICTFDSFALSLVKKYHYLLNIKRDIAIIEENIIYLEMIKELERIFERLYAENDSLFTQMVSDLCVKDDRIIKEAIIHIYQKVNLRIDKEKYLQVYTNEFFSDENLSAYISKYLNVIKEKINNLKQIYKKLYDLSPEEYQLKLDDFGILFKQSNYNDLKEIILNISIPRIPPHQTPEFKDLRDKLKDHLDNLKPFFRFQNETEMKEAILKTKDYLQVIIDVIFKLDNYLNKFKKRGDTYTFLDIAKMAYKIVSENENIRQEITNSFDEIMIDEYQDTSDIQEAFINLISNNNVYMVGDLKQSIYRFRNANPEIFKQKYENYKTENGGIKIDLVDNFRSRKEVVDDINLIFNHLMTPELGGVDYQNEGQMNFGNKQYETNKQNHHFEVYNYYQYLDHGFTKPEIEAFIIARDIREKVGKFLIFDGKKTRPAKYADFTILCDRGRYFSLYKRIFEYMQIPLTIIDDEVLTNEADMIIINNVMKLVFKIARKEFDREFKYLFTSIARSYLCNLDDELIFNYFVNDSFHTSEIYQKCYQISLEIDNLSHREFLETIIEHFAFYEKIITIGSIAGIFVRLEYLFKLADSLANTGYSLVEFVGFISEMIENKLEIKYSLDKSTSEGVIIMNIHKSKGLEFPICYYSGLYLSFNKEDQKRQFSYDNSIGIIAPYYEDGIKETILKDLYLEKTNQEDLSERMRLFYVALTRCKEKMIFLTDFDSEEEVKIKRLNSFKDFLLQVPITKYVRNLRYDPHLLSLAYQKVRKTDIDIKKDFEKPLNVKELKIKPQVKTTERFSKVNPRLLTPQEKANLEFGKKIHYFLEIIDFKNPELEKYNLDKRIHDKIEKFLNCELLKDLHHAQIYKEYEFIYQNRHGIIDLILEYQDHVVVIDYKTKNIDDQSYIKQIEGYKDYLAQKTGKKVYGYLYSLIDENYQEI